MKKHLVKLLFVCFISIGLVSITSIAEAYYCRWVPAHYSKHGYYIPTHRICYQGYNPNRCWWVGGHYSRHGYYIPGHIVCKNWKY